MKSSWLTVVALLALPLGVQAQTVEENVIRLKETKECRGCDLEGADLSRARLNGTNLQGASLGGAELTRANLSDAILVYADLSGADLSGAGLWYANMRGTILCNTILPTDTGWERRMDNCHD